MNLLGGLALSGRRAVDTSHHAELGERTAHLSVWAVNKTRSVKQLLAAKQHRDVNELFST